MSSEPQLIFVEDHLEVSFSFSLATAAGFETDGVRLIALPQVVLDAGRHEKEPPVGAPVPLIVGWYKASSLISTEATIELASISRGEHRVVVIPPPGTAVELTIKQLEA